MPVRRSKRKPNWPLRLVVTGTITGLFLILGITTAWTVASDSGHGFYPEHVQSALLSRAFDLLVACWFFVLGSSFASFLNVVAYRLPRRMPITGFSRCPYCYVDIHGDDNVPLLGWLKLRGRCRACRLPISARYPGFELLGGLLATALFMVECITHASNLPNWDRQSFPFGMLVGQMDWPSLMISLAHGMVLFFLLAAAMIRWGGQPIPTRLMVIGTIAWCLVAIAWPRVFPIDWKSLTIDSSGLTVRLQSMMNAIAGAMAGLCLGRLLATVIYPDADRRFLSSDRQTKEGLAWILGLMLAGSSVGWQAAFSVMLWTLFITVGERVVRWRSGRDWPFDPTQWLWLGYFFHLATWRILEAWPIWPGSRRELPVYLLAAALGWLMGWLLRQSSEPEPPITDRNPQGGSEEVIDDSIGPGEPTELSRPELGNGTAIAKTGDPSDNLQSGDLHRAESREPESGHLR